MRILITGSRNLKDSLLVSRAISVAIEELAEKNPDDKEIVIVHGAAPGADTLAGDFVSQAKRYLHGVGYSVREERHPADWSEFGKAAGHIRNQEMVDLGADICVAFPHSTSRGTKDCMSRAGKAGIEIRRYDV